MGKNGYKKEPRGNYHFLVIVIVALFLAFLVNTFFYGNTHVVGNSMTPLLHNNDWILVDRRAYQHAAPAFGDIVVVEKPDVTGQPIIKRIIGLPADTLQIRSGHLYRDGKPVAHDFALMAQSENMRPVAVPRGCYFLMGDNRNQSNDSRRWKDPFVRRDEILGKALFRYFPSYLNLKQT